MESKSKPAILMEKYMEERGVTKANAARKIGMSYESFRGLFSGKCVWRVDTVVALGDFLRLTDKERMAFMDSFRSER